MRLFKHKLLINLLILASAKCYAQSAEDSVKQVINGFFEALNRSDTAIMRTYINDGAIFQTVTTNNGIVRVVSESVDEFCTAVSRTPAGSLDEKITFEKVMVDGCLAAVWTPYKFFFNNKFLHCGVNSFQMVRIAEKWRIQYIIDTRRIADCK